MKRRDFLLSLPILTTLSSCRKVSDEELFAAAQPTRLMLAANRQIQAIADQHIAAPIRTLTSNKLIKNMLPPDTDCAFVCLENANGNVLAYIGTIQLDSELDNCRSGRRDIGSIAKLFTDASALEMHAIAPTDVFLDAPMTFSRLDNRGTYTADNYARSYTHRWLSIEESIARSSNVVALQIYHRADKGALIEKLKALNLPTDFNINLLPLGRWNVPILSLASASTIFARGGDAVLPRFITATIQPSGQRVDEPIRKTPTVFSPVICEIISSAMQACVSRGTGTAAADLAAFVRGKTGSSSDALAVLQSKAVTAALWIGRRDSNRDLKMTGGRISMPALARFFRELRRARPDLVPNWD